MIILSLILSILTFQNTVPGTVFYDRMFNSLTMSEKITPSETDNISDNRKWVQNFIQSSWVSKDGSIYAYSNWDEGNHAGSTYKNGDLIDVFTPRLKAVVPNWGDITGDDSYVYMTSPVNFGNWVYNGCGVLRMGLDGSYSGWSGGLGQYSAYFAIRDSGTGCSIYRNITVNKTKSELYVTDSITTTNKIFVFKTSPVNPRPIDSFTIQNLKDFAADDSGLWVIVNDSVKYYSSRGIYTGIYLQGVLKPTLLSYSRQNELMVWDDSLCIVRFYRFPKQTNRHRSFGLVGGMYTADSANRKFDFKTFPPGLRGMGTDTVGNIYLSWGYGYPSFSDMRAFNKQGDSLWHLYSATFVGVAGFDYTKDGTEAFTTQHRFSVNWSNPQDKKSTFVGYTKDYRNNNGTMGGQSTVRYVGGKRIIIQDNNDLYGNGFTIYADMGQFIKKAFVISNGDGDAFYVDYNGDIWDATRTLEIRKYKFSGFRNKLPIWDTVNYVKYKSVTSLGVRRIFYDIETDGMVLTGMTSQYNIHDDKSIGRVIMKFDNWSTSRTLAWQDTLALDTLNAIYAKAAVDVCEDYVFYISIGDEPRTLYVKSSITGADVGKIYPGPEIQGDIDFIGMGYAALGWLDTPFGLNCFKRNNGQYVITIENDLTANNFIYRWCPTGDCQ